MPGLLAAAPQSGLDRDEALRLTRAIAESGERLAWDILESGRALATISAVIRARGRNHQPVHAAALSFGLDAPANGYASGHAERHAGRWPGSSVDL
jgi:thymidine phosphorylase